MGGCALSANHFVEGKERSKDQSENAKEGDTEINALHAVALVSFLITPASPDGSGRMKISALLFRLANRTSFPMRGNVRERSSLNHFNENTTKLARMALASLLATSSSMALAAGSGSNHKPLTIQA